MYDAAIAARMGEAVMAGLRGALIEAGKQIDAAAPEEPERRAGEKLLEGVRAIVVNPDAAPENVAFYESVAAADAFRRGFMGPAHGRVTELAESLGLIK